MFDSHAVLDETSLSELAELQVEGEPSFVGGLIRDYLAQLESMTEAIAAHQSKGEVPMLERAAHKLKSSSAALGLKKVAAICAAIEANARSGSGSPQETQALSAAVPEAKAALTSYAEKLA
jgi:HPt (histidine-containing phosphotransfer) domain-containing protein